MPALNKIFERALTQSMSNGYEPIPDHKVTTFSVRVQNNLGSYVSLTLIGNDETKRIGILVGLNDMLFDPEFAKALFGELDHEWKGEKLHETCSHCGACKGDLSHPDYCFKQHLQQMAIIGTVKGRLNYIASTLPKRGKQK